MGRVHISISPSPSYIERRRRATLQSNRTKSLGGKKLLRRFEKMSQLFPGSFLFIGEEASSHIQISTISESQFASRIFRHDKSVGYDLPQPCDLIHHEVRISVINLSVVFTHSSFQRGFRIRKGILTSPFRVQATPQLLEPEPNQFSSLFLLGAWRKRKRRGICNGQFLTPRSRHGSHLIRNSRRQITGYAKQSNPKSIAQLFLRSLLLLRNQPRGYSSFRGIHYPGDTPPSESITIPRSIFFILSKTATSTNLIDSRLYSWSPLCR